MLRLSAVYKNRAILSLRTGSPVGNAIEPIINPSNLKIEAWHAVARGQRDAMILPSLEIRDIIPKGLVVNDHDAITHPEDMVRMQSVIDLEFSLLGKPVRTESGKRLGKVSDYAVDDKSFFIQKIYVNPSLLKSLSSKPLIIDRRSITEITPHRVVVLDTTQKLKRGRRATVPVA